MTIKVKNDEMLGRTDNTTLHIEIMKLQQENKQLKEELKYTVPIVEHNKIVSKKLKENQNYKEVIDKITDLIKQYGKYDGEICTRGFQMWSADFNKMLEVLKVESDE